MRSVWLWLWFVLMATAGSANAQEPSPQQQAEMQRLIALRDSLHPVRGVVKIPKAQAVLNLGQAYDFLDATEAKRVIIEGWGNPPETAEDVLGLVFPAGKTFLDDSWGAVITYEKTFYVSDDDAKTADYDALLSDMREGEDERNAERQKAGYSAIHLIGWAQPPSYEPSHHTLIWARDVQFGDEADHTLNYDVRHLGREGVLSMNIVSTMSHLPEVRGAADAVGRTAEFVPGQRYADYKDGDKRAGYGLAGLVAAGVGLGVAKKAGLLAVLLIFLKKGFVFILAAGAAAAGWFRNLFRKPAKTGPSPMVDADPDDAPADEDPSGRS